MLLRLILKNIFIAFFVCIVIMTAPFYIVATINNTYTGMLEDEMRKSTPPPQTEIIEVISYFGNTTGRSNHAEAWIGILIKSKLTKEELEKYYKDLYRQTIVYKIPEDRQKIEALSMLDNTFESLAGMTDYDGYYIVERIEPRNGLLWFFDVRGH